MRACAAAFAVALLASAVVAQTGTLKLVVSYCPTDFTAGGAVVTVDVHSGAYTIDGKFNWPSDVFGCVADYDPLVMFNAAKDEVYFDFTTAVIPINLISRKVGPVIHPSDPFFTGFYNFQYFGHLGLPSMRGFSGTVEESGFCSDGCFSYGELFSNGKYTKYKDIPFKAIMDDSHFYDGNMTYYIQGSYDLRPMGQRCAPNDSDECLLAINAVNGNLISAQFTPNWTAYGYAPKLDSNGNVLAWMEGFDKLCQHPYNNFLFGKIDLATATATPGACIPKDVTVDMDEWIGAFSLDQTLFATGSGNAETGVVQLLVFNTATGAVQTQGQLSGLPAALKPANGLIWIWAVEFV